MSEDELDTFRQLYEYSVLDRIKALENEVGDLRDINNRHIQEYRLDAPTLSVLRHIASFGVVARWVIISVIGVLSAIGIVQVAYETIQKWVAR